MYFTDLHKIDRISAVVASGTTDVNGTSVDLQADGGWDGVVFLASLGTPAADNIMKAQQSDDNGSTDGWSDLADSGVPVGASDESQFIDLHEPAKRYVRPVITRGTASTVESIWAIRYRGRSVPVENIVSGTINGVRLNRPAEGTA